MQVSGLRQCRDFACSKFRLGRCKFIGIAADRSGATIIDYALLAGLVALAAVTGFQLTGTAVAGMFNAIATAFIASMPLSP